jgi:hypothetical protein
LAKDKVGELAAVSWVRDNVQAYYPDVDIRYVIVVPIEEA